MAMAIRITFGQNHLRRMALSTRVQDINRILDKRLGDFTTNSERERTKAITDGYHESDNHEYF